MHYGEPASATAEAEETAQTAEETEPEEEETEAEVETLDFKHLVARAKRVDPAQNKFRASAAFRNSEEARRSASLWWQRQGRDDDIHAEIPFLSWRLLHEALEYETLVE